MAVDTHNAAVTLELDQALGKSQKAKATHRAKVKGKKTEHRKLSSRDSHSWSLV